MEQLMMNSGGINALISQVGCYLEDSFFIAEEATEALQEILQLLQSENTQSRPIRHQLALTNIIPKTLIPVLLNLDEAEETERNTIFSLTIRLMMNMTQPIDCLFSQTLPVSKASNVLVKNIEHALSVTKTCFVQPQVSKVILANMTAILAKTNKAGDLSAESCEVLISCLFLLRNVLFITAADSPQEDIPEPEPDNKVHLTVLGIWLQFRIKDVLIQMMTSPQHETWCVPMVQLVSLLYREEIHESGPLNSKGRLTGGFSDSSKLGSDECGNNLETKCKASQSEYSEDSGGSGAMSCDQSSPSGDSRSMASSDLGQEFNSKLNNLHLRKELGYFTEEFIQKGLSNLIRSVRKTLLFNNSSKLPDLYFMWMVDHFLKLACRLKVPFSAIKDSLSLDVVGYLVYVSTESQEKLILEAKKGKDTVSEARRMHLSVVALNSIFKLLAYAEELDLDSHEKVTLNHMKSGMVMLKDLRNLFTLLIHNFSPEIHSLDFLSDLVVTNHQYLLLAEHVLSWGEGHQHFDMLEHISKFGTSKIMYQYGVLLDNFENNQMNQNDCIFTMMYHVAGDCEKPEVLLQLSILKTFMELWDKGYPLTDECDDLMKYTLQQFLNLAVTDPYACAESLFGGISDKDHERMDQSQLGLKSGFTDSNIAPVEEEDEDNIELKNIDSSAHEKLCADWSDEETDIMFSVRAEIEDDAELVKAILNALNEKGYSRTPSEVKLQLFTQGAFIPNDMNVEMIPDNDSAGVAEYSTVNDEEEEKERISEKEVGTLNIAQCVAALNEDGQGNLLHWLQDCLSEACFVKLGGRHLNNTWLPEEPVTLAYAIQNKSIPVVPYTEDLLQGMTEEPVFEQLIEQMGFHLPSDTGRLWPRIPNFWSPSDLMHKISQLGPFSFSTQKYTEDAFKSERITKDLAFTHGAEDFEYNTPTSNKKYNSEVPQMLDLWYMFVNQCRIRQKNKSTLPQ